MATQKLHRRKSKHHYHTSWVSFSNRVRMPIIKTEKSSHLHRNQSQCATPLVVAINNPFLLALAAQAIALVPLLETGIPRKLLLKTGGTGVVLGVSFASMLGLLLQDGSKLLAPARFLQHPSLPLGLNNLSLYPVDKP
jgi:hypothetical protein